MDWLVIFGLVFAFWFATALSYKKGVNQGIKHSLRKLELEQYQIEKLDKELKKDTHDVAMEAMKEEIKNSNKSILN